MGRLHNALPSASLVLVGAWAGAGRSLSFLASSTVWAMSLIACGVTVASMMINDYFDYASGVDNRCNKPHKPLPSGLVSPDVAVLGSALIYVVVLCAACALGSPALRAIVSLSSGATLLYTPLLKWVLGAKNLAVAAVVGLAPLSGALAAAAGAGSADVMRALPPALFAFAGVAYREVLMDVCDAAGDAASGLRTLPVVLGKTCAVLVGACTMMAGAAASTAALLTLPWSATSPPAGVQLCGCVTLVLVCCAKVADHVAAAWTSGFSHAALDEAIDDCRSLIAVGVLLLGALA